MIPYHFLEMSVAFLERVLKHHSAWMAESGFGFTYDPKRERTVVMVEPRRHPMLRAVVDNVMSVIGDGWNFHLVTASANADWLRETLPPERYGYKISWLSLDNLTRDQYSQLLMEEGFWASVDTEHILVVQTDVVVFREWNPLFESYDYVGANYYHPDDVFPSGYQGGIGGIQGGLSYRRKSAMLRCLKKVTEDDVNAYREAHQAPPLKKPMVEDVYFTHATAMQGMRLPPVPLRSVFAIEAEYYATPFGFHGWNRPYFDEERTRELVWASKVLRRWVFI